MQFTDYWHLSKSVPVVPTSPGLYKHGDNIYRDRDHQFHGYNTGYQYSATGSGIETTSGTLSPTAGDVNVTIMSDHHERITATPTYKMTTGCSIPVHETYSPVSSNHTIIKRRMFTSAAHYKYLPAVIALPLQLQ